MSTATSDRDTPGPGSTPTPRGGGGPGPATVPPIPTTPAERLRRSAAEGDLETTAKLIKDGVKMQADQVGLTALHWAATNGHLEVVKLLLKHKADVNVVENEDGSTPLHAAAWKGWSRCVAALSRGRNAQLGLANKTGFSPLHLACQNGHNQSCRELLLAGAEPDVRNVHYGDTPLHTSARYGHAGVTRILISAQCKVAEQNNNGDTPLHIAVAMGRRKLTRILVEAGCDKTVKNKQGETALDIAARKELKEILAILNSSKIGGRPPSGSGAGGAKRAKESASSKDSTSKNKSSKKKHRKTSVEFAAGSGDMKAALAPSWSPYGCHYYPDTKCFPQPKLDSLPAEPLRKGEQYYLDLAGNIRKGPVGVGYTCYCAPFFKHMEERLDRDKHEIKQHINQAVQGLERRAHGQMSQLTRSLALERTRCSQRHIHLQQWLRGDDPEGAASTPAPARARSVDSLLDRRREEDEQRRAADAMSENGDMIRRPLRLPATDMRWSSPETPSQEIDIAAVDERLDILDEVCDQQRRLIADLKRLRGGSDGRRTPAESPPVAPTRPVTRERRYSLTQAVTSSEREIGPLGRSQLRHSTDILNGDHSTSRWAVNVDDWRRRSTIITNPDYETQGEDGGLVGTEMSSPSPPPLPPALPERDNLSNDRQPPAVPHQKPKLFQPFLRTRHAVDGSESKENSSPMLLKRSTQADHAPLRRSVHEMVSRIQNHMLGGFINRQSKRKNASKNKGEVQAPCSNGWQDSSTETTPHIDHQPVDTVVDGEGNRQPPEIHPTEVHSGSSVHKRSEYPVPPDYENVARWQEDDDTRLVSRLAYRSRSAVYSPSLGPDFLPRLDGEELRYTKTHSRMYSPAQDSGVAMTYMHANGAPPRTPIPYPTQEYGYSPTQEQADIQYHRASGAMYSPDHNDSGCSIRLCGSSNSKGTSPSLSGPDSDSLTPHRNLSKTSLNERHTAISGASLV